MSISVGHATCVSLDDLKKTEAKTETDDGGRDRENERDEVQANHLLVA